MKIINVIGGLGNQMFQYAFALSIQKKYPDEQVLIDNQHCRSLFLKSHKGMNLHQGYELDRVFRNVVLPLADWNSLAKVTRNVPNYFLSRVVRRYLKPLKTEFIEVNPYVFSSEAILMQGDCYYEGYWQSMRYWEGAEDYIRTAMSFKELDDRNAATATEMAGCESVSIHVRRGDYVNNPGFGGICDIDYYQRCIELVKNRMNNPVFYLFTNDHEWCSANIIPLLSDSRLVVVDNRGTDSYKDMQLMTYCKANIIANSSFSWWGAWLNRNGSPLVLAPKKWHNRQRVEELYSNEWIKI